MTTQRSGFLQSVLGRGKKEEQVEPSPVEAPPPVTIHHLGVDIAANDPLVAYFLTNRGAIELSRLNLDSPALTALRDAKVQIGVPLVSQGELIGLLSLGPRRSEQEYSADDRRLLNNLASQAAPSLRVAQLARQQQAAAAERERLEQELRVARIIQQTLLPKETPKLPGWKLSTYWQPARAVGGDFYDFIQMADGRMCVIIADVTDKGVPAALVMASARSVLRGVVEQLDSPAKILERVNDTLVPDIPPKMFITCLCVIFDPKTGVLRFSNAGHNLPILRTATETVEVKATGMPLGLMPGMDYDEAELTLKPGERMLLYSDGISEAHNPDREMFGFERLHDVVAAHHSGALVEHLIDALEEFTGPDWEQEDDVTFVLIKRSTSETSDTIPGGRVLANFTVKSEPGNEREAMDRLASVADSYLTSGQLEKFKTAVAETVMNAMEHGNMYRADLPVEIMAMVAGEQLTVYVTDQGGTQSAYKLPEPDLDAKLAGLDTPRGWGLLLIKNMVDEMTLIDNDDGHTVELKFNLQGDK